MQPEWLIQCKIIFYSAIRFSLDKSFVILKKAVSINLRIIIQGTTSTKGWNFKRRVEVVFVQDNDPDWYGCPVVCPVCCRDRWRVIYTHRNAVTMYTIAIFPIFLEFLLLFPFNRKFTLLFSSLSRRRA